MTICIKNRKDWLIAFILAFLLIYGLTDRYSLKFQKILLGIGNFRLSYWNQPHSYGNLIVTTVIMTILTIVVLVNLKKRIQLMIAAGLTSLLLAAALLGAYLLHCNLIVSVIHTEQPGSVYVSGKSFTGRRLELTPEQELRFIEYCVTLEPEDKQEAARSKEYLTRPEVNLYEDSLNISLHYGQKYGHSLIYRINILDDIIYIRKGYGYNNKDIVTICRDNGLLSYLEEVSDTEDDPEKTAVNISETKGSGNRQ